MEVVMNLFSRRRMLFFGLAGGASFISGCAWDDSSDPVPAAADPSPGPTPSPAPEQPPAPSPAPPSPNPPPAAQAWSVSPTPYFLADTGTTFDLSTTLPATVRRGGTFGVSPSGNPLPAGMSLSATGLLSVGSAKAGRTDGVIFTYEQPAG